METRNLRKSTVPTTNRQSMKNSILTLVILTAPFLTCPAATFTVTTTADNGPGSLRQAILDANANPGPDTIDFAIGTGMQTVAPLSPMPTISDPVVIDGWTQPGFIDRPFRTGRVHNM